jgi:hypothetical protein
VTLFVNHSTQSLLRIEAIFHEALAVSDEERLRLIEARCNGDSALVAEVQSLLKGLRGGRTGVGGAAAGDEEWPGRFARAKTNWAL